MTGVCDNINKRIPKLLYREVSIMVVHTINNIFNYIKLNQAKVEKWILSQAVKDLLELYISMSKGAVTEVVQKQIRDIIWHMVKTIRRSVILSNTWNIHLQEILRECVYICYPFCDFFCPIKTRRIYTFLFLWIHVITRWKMFKRFKNSVEGIEHLQLNWSLIALAICTSWC